MNINEQLNKGLSEHGMGSNMNYFKFKEGDNRIRVLTEGQIIGTHFFGKGVKASTCYGIEKGCPFHGINAPKDEKGEEKKLSLKYTCYVIDKNDKNEDIQLADLTFSVIKQIGDLQENVDYAFDSFPMPYDITIKYDPKAAPVQMYKVIASPKREPVTDIIMGKLAEKMAFLTPAESVKKKKEFEIKNHTEQGIIITTEKAKENRKAWVASVNAEAKETPSEPVLEYPESINPDDIPF
jgi:hypothetical protein